jgi:hypothetical protein
MIRAIAVGATTLTLLLLGCEKPSPLPEDLAATIQTPEGNEVKVTCPPSFEVAIGPTKLAEILSRPGFPQPEPGDIPPGAFARPGSLCTLLPPDPISGQPIDFCPAETYPDAESFFLADEELLDQMGRLCGISVSLYGPDYSWEMDADVELYATTPGAKEAFRRSATGTGFGGESDSSDLAPNDDEISRSLRRCHEDALRRLGDTTDFDLLLSLGDERELGASVGLVDGECSDFETYDLLLRRRNVISRIDLSFQSTAGEPPVTLLLNYAAQLDRNIEAAAAP